MRKIFSSLVTLAFIGFAIYSRIPSYTEFTSGEMDAGPNEYSYFEITSESQSPIKVVMNSQSTVPYDAYLLTEAEMQKVNAWMESDEEAQPNINFMAKWEQVTSISQEDIIMPKGTFYLFIDNTSFGSDVISEEPVIVDYTLYEKI